MLMPKKVKFRKQQRGRMAGKAWRGSDVSFGDYGLKALEPCWLTDRQIEAARVAMTRFVKRGGKTTAWPAGAAIEVAAEGHDGRLVAVARVAGKLELLAVATGKLERAPIGVAGPGRSGTANDTAALVGVAVDRAGRAVIAFRAGRIAVRDGGAWTTVTVGVELPSPRPGAPPAVSP
jgi:hypothetical protein